MGKMNARWHEAHPMPDKPSPDQRIAWHLDHAQNCGCRAIPKGVLALMEARGQPAPRPSPSPPPVTPRLTRGPS